MSHLEQYLRPRPRLSPVSWCIPVVMAAALLGLGNHAMVHGTRLDELKARNATISADRLVKPAPRPRPAEIEQQKRWAELRSDRDFPSRKIFDAVERADRSTIELLEFRPDKRTRRIILRGEARDVDSLTAYLEALAADASFREVYLVHSQVIARAPLTTIGFEIKSRVVLK